MMTGSLLLTLDEVATLLRLSRSTVERLAAGGQLISVAPSPGERSLRFRPADVEAYVAGLPPKRAAASVTGGRSEHVKEMPMGERRYGVIPPNPRAQKTA